MWGSCFILGLNHSLLLCPYAQLDPFTVVRRALVAPIRKFVFAEPSGWPKSVVQFSGALAFLGIYVYFGLLGDSETIYELVLGAGFALSGIAESLPNDRRRTAGLLRIAAVLLLTGLLAALVIAPELINPR